MTRPITLVHTSDIHLDNTIGEPGSESPAQQGLQLVVEAALALEADLFLLAGDLFDHNRIKAPCLEFASSQLARLNCPVVMIAGNHDCLADYSIYHTYNPGESRPDLHFLKEATGDKVVFPDLGIQIWGQGIVEHSPDNRPLAGMPEPVDGWHIGMAHGYFTGRGGDSYSSLITAEEIASSPFDYLALGHVHVFDTMQLGDTLACYCGSPNLGQGARERTAAHVVLHPETGVTVKRLLLRNELLDTAVPDAVK